MTLVGGPPESEVVLSVFVVVAGVGRLGGSDSGSAAVVAPSNGDLGRSQAGLVTGGYLHDGSASSHSLPDSLLSGPACPGCGPLVSLLCQGRVHGPTGGSGLGCSPHYNST